MQYIKGLDNYHNDKPTAITIGKFDGLHRGHELLIEKVIEYGKMKEMDTVVLAFDTSTLSQSKQILTSEERKNRLDGRVDYLVECPLNKSILHMEAEDFIKDILVEKFHVKCIVVGEDFSFGYQRKGTSQLLKEMEKKYNYQVEIVKKICYNGREISSSYIREILEENDYELAEKLLGYNYKEMRDL